MVQPNRIMQLTDKIRFLRCACSRPLSQNRKKGIAPLLAGALYVGIISVAVLVVVQIGGPAVTKMQDITAFDQAKDSLANLDKIIEEVAAEGKGSTRVVPIQIKKGTILVDAANDRISYSLDTQAEIVSPRTRRDVGNLYFSSNSNVDVTDNGTDIIVENEYWIVIFNKTGNSTDFAPINTSLLVKSIYLKDANRYLDAKIAIWIDGDSSSEIGNGYVYATKTGKGLARGTVIAHTNNSVADYNLYYTLESGRDYFSEIAVKDYNSHI